MLIWNAFGEQWELNHKVTFDGENRIIHIADSVPSIDVKNDIYSSWKEWIQLYDNSKYLSAMRVTGGDPTSTTGDVYTGDIYFLVNNWRIYVHANCEINGVIYSDDYPSPYLTDPDTKFIINKVSNLVQSLGFSGTVNANMDDAARSVWDYLMTDATVPGSVGERLGKLLTVAKYLGLK